MRLTRRLARSAALAAVLGAVWALPASAQDDYEARREAMVDALAGEGIVTDARVIEAMKAVPRHLFVPQGQAGSAYDDAPLPIGEGQTISAPSIVGMMTEALQPEASDRVLEIGTGSGYQAAVLAKLVRHVYTIEILEPLATRATTRLRDLEYTNVTVRHGDGYQGWPEQAPFDRIIVTAAPEEIPQALIDQLKDGGLMVIPIAEDGWAQKLYLLKKNGAELEKTELADVIFVPMTGGEEQ
ncbi:MAG: protein-L-isoaspartate(D-aspartate) O-methyltransferase [Armatimonadota bacterium]|jgi:protein-L-isoaspartate(D-aspartate) O-methyltransferase